MTEKYKIGDIVVIVQEVGEAGKVGTINGYDSKNYYTISGVKHPYSDSQIRIATREERLKYSIGELKPKEKISKEKIEVGDRVKCIFDLGVCRSEIGKEGIIIKISGPYPESKYHHLRTSIICHWKVDSGRHYYSANMESFTLVEKGKPSLVSMIPIKER